jgi:hypothetical protein
MHDKLKAKLRLLITQPRPLKPQTERHILEHLDGEPGDWQRFFDNAAEQIEEFEIETLFGPIFTPSFDEQAEVAELLVDAVPDDDAIEQLVDDLAADRLGTEIHLPDGTTATLPLHAIMIERYVKLQRLSHAPATDIAIALSDVSEPAVRRFALAIARHRAFGTHERQTWLARFLTHVASRRAVGVGDLVVLAEFMSTQRDLEHIALAAAITDAVRSSQTALTAARQGHTYLSSDVAEHHHYRGQGNIDPKRVSAKKQEALILELLEADLHDFLEIPTGS